MGLIAGIDIGNASTEVALAELDGDHLRFVASSTIPTTGIKGTDANLVGIFQALQVALKKAGRVTADLELVRINEAAPVIGDVAMETITETIITESTMIGHNPATPGGLGIGVGTTIAIDDLATAAPGVSYIVVADHTHPYDRIASALNEAGGRVEITGAILQLDDGVLVHNRLRRKIPIVDEVGLIEKVPLGMLAAIEVAEAGRIVETLANPFGIATLFGLDAEDTKQVVPLARSLVGNRSAVVIKTPKGDVQERRIPAGRLTVHGAGSRAEVDVDRGAEEIMAAVAKVRRPTPASSSSSPRAWSRSTSTSPSRPSAWAGRSRRRSSSRTARRSTAWASAARASRPSRSPGRRARASPARATSRASGAACLSTT